MSTTKTRHYDVIIAGARCAGAATALLLARQGARVLVLDKSRYGTDTLSTHALMRGAVLQLHRWGVLPAVAGAGGRFGASVSDLRRDPAGRVTGITGRAGGARLEASADLVIGADGRRSTVAWCVGARAAHVAPAPSVLIYRYVRDDAPDDYHWYFRDGAAAGVIPTNDGQACVFAATSAERLRDEPDLGTYAAWRRLPAPAAPGLAERLDQRGPAGPPRVFPGLTGYLREVAGPGWALVGDAGYFKDPITAHGITDALRDAEILARAVAAGGPDAVGRYQAERDELSLRLFRVTGRIASFDWTAEEIGGHLLELGEGMAEEAGAGSAGAPRPRPPPGRAQTR